MPLPLPSPIGFDPEAAEFVDLTLAFDALWGAVPGAALTGRRFLRCNLTGPALVALGRGNRFEDNVFSACAVTATDGGTVPGALLLEDCRFEDCVLTRWSLFLQRDLALALTRDVPALRVFGLPW